MPQQLWLSSLNNVQTEARVKAIGNGHGNFCLNELTILKLILAKSQPHRLANSLFEISSDHAPEMKTTLRSLERRRSNPLHLTDWI